MSRFFDALKRLDVSRCFVFSDRQSGLEAFLVVDDLTLGPAVGGVRTRRYPSSGDALEEAAALAHAMTIKCALAGLDAGGGKVVVVDHGNLDRPRAFAELGRRIQELGGMFRTAGDYGTTADDIAAMASTCEYVHEEGDALAGAVARSVTACMEVCATLHGDTPLGELRIAVQGCGFIGEALARSLAETGATLLLADTDAARATSLAEALGATTVDPADALTADVDIVAPCAVGGVIDETVAGAVKAWAVCGAANNILASSAAGAALFDRGILFVPDVLSSAGGAIDGIGATVMGLSDRGPLFEQLAATARDVLEASRAEKRPPTPIAVARARARIQAARTGESTTPEV